MGRNKEVPGAISIYQAARGLGMGESTFIRETNKIKPPVKTIEGGKYLSKRSMPRIERKLRESGWLKPRGDELHTE